MDSKTLFIIPARGGSKGIPYKNIKNFVGKPLIVYSIDLARKFVADKDICVSTDDQKIIDIVESYGLKVPFIRPKELATDTASTNDVLLHALMHYKNKENIYYERIVLLQPTSPLREEQHIREALDLYSKEADMIVSVCRTDVSSVLCKDNEEGFIEPIFNKHQSRRQDIEPFYVYNGAIYVINVKSLINKGIQSFEKKIKYVMPQEKSIDIDTSLDWTIAEILYKRMTN